MGAPWFIGGGAEHSPEIARLLAYAGTNGAQGITRPGDYKVRQTATASRKLRIMPGSAVILNRSAAGNQQSYMTRRGVEELTADLTVTGSGGGRSDLIVQRIEDPQYSPWPTMPANDPAWLTKTFDPFVVIPGVPASTRTFAELGLGYSAIELARVDIPANTSTITDAMVKDLRKLAQPRQHREVLMTGYGAAETTTVQPNGTIFQLWPSYRPGVIVPDWATTAKLLVTISGVQVTGANVDGQFRALMGASGALQPSAVEIIDYDQPATVRETLVAASGRDVTALQGQMMYVASEVQIGRGALIAAPGTHHVYDLMFYENPA